jgi:periplasmic divalent cation tolerance protein
VCVGILFDTEQSLILGTSMHLIEIHTTVAAIEDAQNIAIFVVEQKLAACADIAEVKSYYHWDGALQHTAEFRITIKTTDMNYTAIETAIRQLHPYFLPAIYALAVEQAYEPYKNWVIENSAPANS